MLKIFKKKIKILRKLGNIDTISTKKIQKRKKTPGEHGILKTEKINNLIISNDYSTRLLEKQKLRYYYGLSEKQLFLYYKKAKKQKGLIIDNFLKILESRLNYIIFKIGFVSTIFFAKQLINHNHILINNKLINISNYLCSKKDIITIRNTFKNKKLINNKNLYLNTNLENYFENINYMELLAKFNLTKIIEYYSK